jgi:hypothetical protein
MRVKKVGVPALVTDVIERARVTTAVVPVPPEAIEPVGAVHSATREPVLDISIISVVVITERAEAVT